MFLSSHLDAKESVRSTLISLPRLGGLPGTSRQKGKKYDFA